MVDECKDMVVDKGENGTSVNKCKYSVEGRAWHVFVCVKGFSHFSLRFGDIVCGMSLFISLLLNHMIERLGKLPLNIVLQ